MDRDFVRKDSLSANSLQQNARRDHSHLVQRLTNRGEARIMKCRSLNVIEAHHRNISGDLQAGVLKRPDGPDCRDIVIRKQSRERPLAGEQLLGKGIT